MLKTARFIINLVLLCPIGYCSAQSDNRPVIGVSKFSYDIETPYAGGITEKVVEMLTQSKRFQVVDRTSFDKVVAEKELQKTENFIDSKHLTEQGASVGADYILTGQIRQINVIRMLNSDGTVGGYKASLSFTMKVVATATGLSSEAQSFETKGGNRALSPQRAVDEAIRTLTEKLEDYFAFNFPLNIKIVKILSTNGGAATAILIAGGKSQGLVEGDRFIIQKIEILEGKPYPIQIAVAKVSKVVSEDFSECTIKGGSEEVLAGFKSNQKLSCQLVIQK